MSGKDEADKKRLLTWAHLKTQIPYSRSHIIRLEAKGLFPRRIKVGPRRVAWLESDIDGWVQDKLQRSNALRNAGRFMPSIHTGGEELIEAYMNSARGDAARWLGRLRQLLVENGDTERRAAVATFLAIECGQFLEAAADPTDTDEEITYLTALREGFRGKMSTDNILAKAFGTESTACPKRQEYVRLIRQPSAFFQPDADRVLSNYLQSTDLAGQVYFITIMAGDAFIQVSGDDRTSLFEGLLRTIVKQQYALLPDDLTFSGYCARSTS